MENPKGCQKGSLVNEETVKAGLAKLAVYQGRGLLKYQQRINPLNWFSDPVIKKINIVDYNPDWQNQFLQEKEKLLSIFGDLALSIHHIGSTAIKTTKAKPEIDILIVVKDDSILSEYDRQMIDLGYRVRGECLDAGGTPGRFYYSKDVDNVRTHKVHLCKLGHKDIMEKLLFVKYLNDHPDQGRVYAQLKSNLSKKYDYRTIADYLKEKGIFIKEVIKKAKQESSRLGYQDFL